jgi:hypothetical protein
MSECPPGLVEYWLRNIREVRRTYNDELMAIADKEVRLPFPHISADDII